MTDTISYQYAAASTLQRSTGQDELFLAKYCEIEKKEAPCFFWGRLTQPYLTARCLIALSNCAGVYAQVDILPDGHDGEFPENGTTNVDFNPVMISALGSIGKQEKVATNIKC